MEIHRSFGISRLVELMAANRRSGRREPDLLAPAQPDSGFRSDNPGSGAAANGFHPQSLTPVGEFSLFFLNGFHGMPRPGSGDDGENADEGTA